jgi:hypothetical protein
MQLGETVLMKAASKGDTSACVQLLLNGALFNNRDFVIPFPFISTNYDHSYSF